METIRKKRSLTRTERRIVKYSLSKNQKVMKIRAKKLYTRKNILQTDIYELSSIQI
jgi:hypothetical protein